MTLANEALLPKCPHKDSNTPNVGSALIQPELLKYASPMEASEEEVSFTTVPETKDGAYSNIALITSHELAGPSFASSQSCIA